MVNLSSSMTNLCVQELPQATSTPLALLYGISAVPAILGNAAFLIVIFKCRSLRTVSNLLLSSLALADFLVGLVIDPVWVIRCILAPKPYNHPLKITIDSLWIQTSATTTFSLCVVSLDRYVAIRSALHYHQIMTHGRCYAVVILVWIASLAFGLSRFFVKNPTKLPTLWMCVSVVTVLLPTALIVFCYVHIFGLARRQSKTIATQTFHLHSTHHATAEVVRHRKAAKTVGLVVGLFLISWFPTLVASFVHLTARDGCTKINMRLVWLWVELLAFASSGVNPWLYSIRNNEFRKEMIRVFRIRRFASQRKSVRAKPVAFNKSNSTTV